MRSLLLAAQSMHSVIKGKLDFFALNCLFYLRLICICKHFVG